MRTSVPQMLPLFRSEMQVRLLALLMLQPERTWTAQELSGTLGTPMASLHRELGRIESAGLLIREEARRPHLFRADTSSPLYEPLRELLRRTIGLEDELRVALDIPGVVAAAIHGSWAGGGQRRPDSDVDVVVIGDADIKDVRKRARPIAERAGRRLDLTMFTSDQIRTLAADRRGFALHLLKDPIVPLVGDVREAMRT